MRSALDRAMIPSKPSLGGLHQRLVLTYSLVRHQLNQQMLGIHCTGFKILFSKDSAFLYPRKQSSPIGAVISTNSCTEFVLVSSLSFLGLVKVVFR